MNSTTQIKRNADGSYNLSSLRAAVAREDGLSVYQQSGTWIIGRYSEAMGAIIETPCHPLDTERDALIKALRLA